MDLDPVFLSRLQFAFLISFHIIFPSFTIGLAAWLATIEGARLVTGKPALPARLRLLAQGVRGLVRHGRGDGCRDGVPVRHQLGRAGAEGRLDPGAAARLRSFHRLHAGGDVLRRDAARARPRVAALLFLRLLHGLARDDVLVVLDSRQQQLDAGAARPHDRRRQDHPCGLEGDRARVSDDGPLAAHAARCIPDDRHVRGSHRRLVCVAQYPSRRGARDAALGAWLRRGSDSDPALLRPPDGSLRPQASAGEVRGDRSALEDAAAGQRSADGDSRREERTQSLRDRNSEARQHDRLGQLDRERDRTGGVPERRPPTRGDPVLRLSLYGGDGTDHARGLVVR